MTECAEEGPVPRQEAFEVLNRGEVGELLGFGGEKGGLSMAQHDRVRNAAWRAVYPRPLSALARKSLVMVQAHGTVCWGDDSSALDVTGKAGLSIPCMPSFRTAGKQEA
jgi:hypothetical protein